MTEWIPPSFTLQPLGKREVVADFDGGQITSDAGALLLREVDAKFGFLDAFAACFTDHRDAKQIEHVEELMRKIDEYFQAGVTLVWVVHVEQALVYVYESPTNVRVLSRANTLERGTALPGFRLPLSALFSQA
jgi:hypothetical protein